MRTLSLGLLALAFVVAGCDAAAPSASADAKSAPYTIVGPSSVQAGSCDTFTIADAQGNPQSGSNWAVADTGYLTASNATSAFVLAEYGSPAQYTLSVVVNGTPISKTVSITRNWAGTYEC